jgi:hypothetical protein
LLTIFFGDVKHPTIHGQFIAFRIHNP